MLIVADPAMGQCLSVTGVINAGPVEVSDSDFPAGSSSIPFAIRSSTRSYNVDTGKGLTTINSPSAFQDLGISSTVTRATFLYVRSAVPMTLKVTQNGGSPQSIPFSGLFILEPPPGQEVTDVQVQGVGSVEFYAAGQQ